jgi:hypothetical protein
MTRTAIDERSGSDTHLRALCKSLAVEPDHVRLMCQLVKRIENGQLITRAERDALSTHMRQLRGRNAVMRVELARLDDLLEEYRVHIMD